MSLDARKLGLILSRLSSDHDGEALNAARIACRMLAEAGMRPEQLTPSAPAAGSGLGDRLLARMVQQLREENMRLERQLRAARAAAQATAQAAPRPASAEPPPGGKWATLVDEVLDAGIYLTAWEREWLASMRRWTGEMSPRQQAVWQRLQARLQRHRADMAGAA